VKFKELCWSKTCRY